MSVSRSNLSIGISFTDSCKSFAVSYVTIPDIEKYTPNSTNRFVHFLPPVQECKIIEVDNKLTDILGERFGEVPNIEIINEDAMDYDYSQLTGPWWIMVGNLPYNIGTRLLVKLITEVPQIHRYVVMLQDEVAERIVAKPDTKQYGSLSVLASLFTNSKVQFNVSKNCFEPKPKILSTVVTIQRETLIDEDMRMKAFEISKIAFQQKRKKIKTALKDYIDEESSKKLSLDLNLRPQELTPENYLAIAEINS